MKYPLQVLTLLIILNNCLCQLNVERLKIVDKNEKLNNYLVRGNLPIDTHKKFQMKELRGNLTVLTGLNNFQLEVISFLNFLTAK